MTPSNPHFRANPDFRRLLIFGAGGSGREVAWLAEQSWGNSIEIVFLVDQQKYLSKPINGIAVRLLAQVEPSDDTRYFAAIGDPGDRRRVVSNCEACGLSATALLHPRAEISSRVELGSGTLVGAGCVVTTNVAIGRHVHINVSCSISHDVRIGDFSTLSPGVHVSGHVHIGENVFLGTGATIINGNAGNPLVIGDGAVIAAGACVTRTVPPGAMVAGVPAIQKR